jgi:hypothetical protein
MAWMTQEGFKERVIASWPEREEKPIQNYWRDLKASTRKFCKGWGANTNSQIKKDKKILLDRLQAIDREADDAGLNTQQWQERYNVESQLEKIYHFEEVQWQRRGGVKWILKGDSNNGYFHGIANNRKKKCTIFPWRMGRGGLDCFQQPSASATRMKKGKRRNRRCKRATSPAASPQPHVHPGDG